MLIFGVWPLTTGHTNAPTSLNLRLTLVPITPGPQAQAPYLNGIPPVTQTQAAVNQWRLFEVDPSRTKFPGSGTEIEVIPVGDSHTGIKPLAFSSGHGRYIAVTPERALVSVGEWPLHITAVNG